MFPTNWPETLLAFLLVVAIGAWMKYFRNRGKTDNETVDYTNSGTVPGSPKSKPLPKGFGTDKGHPHNRQ